MTLLKAAILGVVEGLTEYLPVSSTGHLILAQRAMDIPQSEEADAYAICIQAGAIVAVLALYFSRIMQMMRGLAGRDADGRRIGLNIILAFLPAVVIGLLFDKTIKSYLFNLPSIVTAWVVGGVAIILISRRARPAAADSGSALETMTGRMALVVGFAQCLAMWPGTSRSLVTILAGILVGLSATAAVEFSFLLGLLTLSASTAYDAMKHGKVMLDQYGAAALGVGFFFAMLSAFIAVKWMVAYLKRHGLIVFGYYRVALALIVGILLAMKIL